MKKLIVGILVCAFASLAFADSYTWSSDTLSTNGQHETSSALPISGWLDRVIVSASGALGQTTTVQVATYVGTTAADVIATATVAGVTPEVIIPRRVGTGSTGTDLTYAVGAGSDALTNLAVQALSVPFERVYLGSSTKVLATLASATTQTNTTTVTFIYEPER